jgi:hypothetical protein
MDASRRLPDLSFCGKSPLKAPEIQINHLAADGNWIYAGIDQR